MNLHFVPDEKFINGAIAQFEEHFPGKNVFIYNGKNKDFRFLKIREELVSIDIDEIQQIIDLIDRRGVKNIFLHCLGPENVRPALKISKLRSLKFYWIFFGSDLYELLNRVTGYPLYENKFSWSYYIRTVLSYPNFFKIEIKKRLRKYLMANHNEDDLIINMIGMIDYFCFWNEQDYLLLKENFETKAEFRYFIYYKVLDDKERMFLTNEKERYNLLINHSASKTGNHLTVFKSVTKEIESRLNKIYVPLSYGNPLVKTAVLAEGRRFQEKFYPIKDFLPVGEYYEMLYGIDLAVFGMNRQEAGGNILFLLNNGVKVFLRERNNLLIFLRSVGFVVFSFEKDFCPGQIRPLSEKEKNHNRRIFQENFTHQRFTQMMEALVD